jgi:hypothetical protein
MKIEDLLRINHKPETLEQCWALIDPLIHACVALNELVADLKEKVEHQEEKLKINSKNSSLPPSKDHQAPKRPISWWPTRSQRPSENFITGRASGCRGSLSSCNPL